MMSRQLGFSNKLRVLLFWLSAMLLGPPTLHTEVEVREEESLVKHRTRLTHWGLLLYRAEEDFHLEPDGEGLLVHCRESLFPLLWNYRDLPPTTGRVEICSLRANYQWNWFGEAWKMRNVRFEGGLDSEIRCDWAEVKFRLRGA